MQAFAGFKIGDKIRAREANLGMSKTCAWITGGPFGVHYDQPYWNVRLIPNDVLTTWWEGACEHAD